MEPHVYQPKGHARKTKAGIVAVPCAVCNLQPGSTIHLLNLPGVEIEQPSPSIFELFPVSRTFDISKASADMERNSPLFFGTGADPSLF